MRIVLLLIGLLIGCNIYAQDNESDRVFENNRTAYWKKKSNWDYSHSINDITFRSDSTFEVYSRPSMGCFSWRSYEGTYNQIGDTMYMYSNYEVHERMFQITYTNTPKRKSYHLQLKTDRDSTLVNNNVELIFNYDNRSHLKDVKRTITLNENGMIYIPFSDVPHRRRLASINFKYQLNGNSVNHYLNEGGPVNEKITELPNTIEILLKENPGVDTVYRTVKCLLRENELTILSVHKTISKYPESDFGYGNWTTDLDYERVYYLEGTE